MYIFVKLEFTRAGVDISRLFFRKTVPLYHYIYIVYATETLNKQPVIGIVMKYGYKLMILVFDDFRKKIDIYLEISYQIEVKYLRVLLQFLTTVKIW